MHLVTVLSALTLAKSNTEVPIIAILSQEAFSIKEYFPNENYTSFISASYIKYVEAAGARAVPVWINQDEEYYRNIVKNTNGLLLPGGAAPLLPNNGYYDAAKTMYKIASEMNQNGDYYSILGICLGMEFLAVVEAETKSILTPCTGQAVALPLKFSKGFRSSKLFSNADETTIDDFQNESVTYNNHQFCVTPTNLKKYGLDRNWDTISTSFDKNDSEFVSIMESKRFPYYGVQFHPEKNIFGHELGTNVPHTEEAIKASQYFTNFFVFESRKSEHRFPTWKEEHASLIYNYQPAFINRQNSIFEQLYLFK